jgi:hypothetical protein
MGREDAVSDTTQRTDRGLPPLPDGTSGTARDFHVWCAQELERRRARDLDFDAPRFERAVAFVLHRLGADGDGEDDR